MPFIVNGVCRYTVNGFHVGAQRQCDNVIDFQIDTTGSTILRSEAVRQQAQRLLAAWHTHIRGNFSSSIRYDSVSWVDLDDVDGTVGEVNTDGTITWPANGGTTAGVGQTLPANVSLLVKKLITADRSRRDGRMYVAGLTENRTEQGSDLLSADLTSLQGAFAAFRTAANRDSAPVENSYDAFMCVVHILTRDGNGNPLTGDFRVVDALQVQSRLATQRRRLRG